MMRYKFQINRFGFLIVILLWITDTFVVKEKKSLLIADYNLEKMKIALTREHVSHVITGLSSVV